MEVEVFLSDSPPLKGFPTHDGKYLIVKLPSVVKNGRFFSFDRKNRRVDMVNYGVTYYVEDVVNGFELDENSLRKVNDIVNNSYPDDIIKQIKIVNKENGNI